MLWKCRIKLSVFLSVGGKNSWERYGYSSCQNLDEYFRASIKVKEVLWSLTWISD